MRWLNTLALATCLVTVVVAQTPKIGVRLPILRQPLIKLAVQPTVAAAPVRVAPITTAATQGIYPYGAQYGAQYATPQIWPGYYPQQNWLNPWSAPSASYWGGYPTVQRDPWNAYGSPYWGGRQVVRLPSRNTVTPVVAAEPTNDAAAVVTPDVVEVKTTVVEDLAEAAKAAEAPTAAVEPASSAESTGSAEPTDAAAKSAETAEEVPLLIAANPLETAEEVPLVIAANPLETSADSAEPQPAVVAPAKPSEESSQVEAASGAETTA